MCLWINSHVYGAIHVSMDSLTCLWSNVRAPIGSTVRVHVCAGCDGCGCCAISQRRALTLEPGAVRLCRGVHPWELAPSASSHVEKEIAPPKERLRKMHEYGNQVRKKRGTIAQALSSRHAHAGAMGGRRTRPRTSSSCARRPCSGSLSDAGAGGAGGAGGGGSDALCWDAAYSCVVGAP